MNKTADTKAERKFYPSKPNLLETQPDYSLFKIGIMDIVWQDTNFVELIVYDEKHLFNRFLPPIE